MSWAQAAPVVSISSRKVSRASRLWREKRQGKGSSSRVSSESRTVSRPLVVIPAT